MTTTAALREKDPTIQFYESLAPEYAQKRITDPLFWQKEFQIFKKLSHPDHTPHPGAKKHPRVIDIGCGTGRDTKFFLKAGYEYMGIDAAQGMLKVASRNNPNAAFQVMNFFDLDFPHNHFDCFWAAASILHVPKKRLPEVMWKIRDVSRYGSIGFISVKEKFNNADADESFESDPLFKDRKRFFSFYKENELKDNLVALGFKIVRCYLKSEPDPKRARWICCFVRQAK